MVLQVYHGSYTKIDAIDLSKGQDNRDFGKGFYVTKFRKHAEAWAKVIGKKQGTEGFVTEFKFYERTFTDNTYKTLRFDDYNEEWLDFVVLNRDTSTQEQRHDYDIIEGPVADDKVQNKIEFYLKGKISKNDFLTELKYHEQTHQICFCTRKSLQMLELIDDEVNLNVIMISEPIIENLILDFNTDEEKATDLFYTSKTFAQLADETTELYKKTWQEIYELLKIELKNAVA
jgi:hypothetical protein